MRRQSLLRFVRWASIIPASLILVEVLLRIYFSFFGTLTDRIMYVYSVEQIQETSSSFIGLPFVAHGPSGTWAGHNSLGFRGPEITLEKPAGVYRIAVTGGSTTYGAGIDVEETWPFQLERILHESYGYAHVQVVNTASVGYTTWNSLANFAFRVVDLQPDLYIIYHGTNDVKARLSDPACYLEQTPIRGLYDGMWRTNGPRLSPFVLVRYLAITFGHMDNPVDFNSWVLPVEDSVDGCIDTPMKTLIAEGRIAERLAENPPVFFDRNLRNIIHLARANGVEVMLSTWAYYPPYVPDFWHPPFDENNTIVRTVASEMEVHLYDLAASMPDDPALWQGDGEHQTGAGSEEQARQYAAWLVETGIIPPP